MTTFFDAPLNESLRDAMLALYLHEAVPNDAYLIQQNMVDRIQTPADLYEYWLLDVLVSQNVPTSPVACAIASVQQLVNSLMLNMEPGYSDDSLSPEQLHTWQAGLNRYSTWTALQQLHNFPDTYLDPTLRLTKTEHFAQLEDDITQARIEPQTIQAAVLGYLARFEEVANLRICNAYIDGEDFANSTYHFVARSPAENAVYWRTLDMRERPLIAPAEQPGKMPPKYDKPLPHAWTDWQRANVPISDKILEHTIRPCWFNNRLFVVWAQVEFSETNTLPAEERAPRLQDSVKAYPLFRLYASYMKYNGSWSTPRVYVEHYCKTETLVAKTPDEIAAQTHTVAVYDHSTSPESLFLMVYSGYRKDDDETGDKDQYDFLRTVRIDKNFEVTSLFPVNAVVPDIAPGTEQEDSNDSRAHVLLIGHLFASDLKNEHRCQFWLPSSVPVFGSVVDGAPAAPSDMWNYNGWQSRIKTLEKDLDIVYDRDSSNIELTLTLGEGFDNIRTELLSFYEDDAKTRERLTLVLIFDLGSLHKGACTLLPGSMLLPKGNDFFVQPAATYEMVVVGSYLAGKLILEHTGTSKFSVPSTAAGEYASLEGKRVKLHLLAELGKAQAGFVRHSPNGKLVFSNNINRTTSGPFSYRMFIGHPLDVQATTPAMKFEQISTLYLSNIVSRLSKDSVTRYAFSIDQSTYQPDGWPVQWPSEQSELEIPLIYGVLIYETRASLLPIQPTLVGGALKTATFTWGAELGTQLQIAPSINSLLDPSQGNSRSLGKAQFIDFTGSSIQFSDVRHPTGTFRAPIRMNTTFVRHLIELADNGMDALLSWDTQHLPEPAIEPNQGLEPMDFTGGYYLYFLELFLYLPWLVAHRLNQEQQYAEAKRWLAFVFDPSRQSNTSGHPGYWQSVPLEESIWPLPSDPSQAVMYPDDPHRIALAFPVHFRKALYGLYIDIELNQGDAAYQELTPDGLAEAKLRYTHVLDLLGPRPDVRQADHWTPITLETLTTTNNPHLRAFEQRLITTQAQLERSPPQRLGPPPSSPVAPLLCLRPSKRDSSLSSINNPYLRKPFNPELIRRWNQAENRLYNLRHNLDIAGNPLNLPLFAAPADPRALLSMQAQGLSGNGMSRLLSPQIPHYRFSFMFALAQNAVQSVIQFGSTLLSLIERKEQAQYLELQQQQAWGLAKIALDIQAQAVSTDEANEQALLATQAIIQGRIDYYEGLLHEGVTAAEKKASALHLNARMAEAAASMLGLYAETLKVPPNMYGMVVGGQRLEGTVQAPMYLLQASATVQHGAAETLSTHEQYRRRYQEWTHARDQAKREAEQCTAQIAALQAQHTATRLQVRQAQAALDSARQTHDFLLSNNRFSRSQTYEWLNSKFSNFYYTAFNNAQSLCQSAEACWQYEMGQFNQTFVHPGAWNSSYRGLGAGETLNMNLQQMYREYVQQHRRDLEIRKTVSLRDLKAKDGASTVNKTWEQIKQALQAGRCEFELTQAMFDADYTGQQHYLRRIKTVSVSFPALLGPYQDLCVLLTQLSSKVEMSATSGANTKVNLRAQQQIALSHGLNDDGQFQYNYQDERYLPFEYTGAVSHWSLTIPNPQAAQSIIDSLQDVIIHLSYTARSSAGL
ncbi:MULTISPECIES: Tc toxin subunit A-related protein [Pseudomonas]|uniref:Efflux RND transporter periplasmic adaptor subunit n=1 Tax=Pseudomonas azadiae TaxID=2843612 RepID=A0ABS6NVZ6_9PSED|nr:MULTISPECIES: neuraminidase-like domain-containing protein [Pseudomonas]MBV4452393.1 efflux RND transporter periplasmic adaptor subunit [Pseudomonas azadiae]NMF42260.1 phage tail tape measure protein [Pseudomonas sp. SWRI 103]